MIISKIINDTNYVYDENFWTGKKNIYINGKQATKVNKKEFVLSNGEEKTSIYIKGSYFSGVTLYVNTKPIELVKNKWYEWILMFAPFVCLALGVFSGVIGGVLSALLSCTAAFINSTICRSKLNIVVKIILPTLITIACFILWWFSYAFIVALLLQLS